MSLEVEGTHDRIRRLEKSLNCNGERDRPPVAACRGNAPSQRLMDMIWSWRRLAQDEFFSLKFMSKSRASVLALGAGTPARWSAIDSGGSPRSPSSGERLREVGNQVGLVFDADGEAH